MGRQFKGKQLSDNLSLSGSFSGSFQGDGSQLTGINSGSIPTLQSVTDQSSTTTNSIILQGSGNQFEAGNAFLKNDDDTAAQLHLGLGTSTSAFISTQRNRLTFRGGTSGNLSSGSAFMTINRPLFAAGIYVETDNFFTSTEAVTLYASPTTAETNAYFGAYTKQGSGYFATTPHKFIGFNEYNYNNGYAGTSIFHTSGSNSYKGILLDFEGNVEIPSGSISGSANSTASFGTYLGDGSQLSGISSTPFPFIGNAIITGSLTVSGSFNAFRVNSSDIILGEEAGESIDGNNTQFNVVIGKKAANTMTLGDYNVFAGFRAAVNGIEPENNVAIGRAAGHSIGNSKNNVFIGYRSGYGRGVSQTNQVYSNNVGIGSFALNSLFENDYNVAIGRNALYLTKGESNIGIGYNAGYEQTTGKGNITIGSGSLGIAGESNQLRIGHADLHVISASLTTGDIIFYNTASAPNFSGSFQGDGSNLTGIETFPFSGSAVITGSLDVSGSDMRIGVFETPGGSGNSFNISSPTQDIFISAKVNGTASLNSTFGVTKMDSAAGRVQLGELANTIELFTTTTISGDTTISGSLTISGSTLNTGIISIDDTDSPYSVLSTDHLIKINSSANSVTINLPDSSTYIGKQIFFKVINGGNTVTLSAQGSDLIDSAATDTTLDSTNEALSIISDGSGNWFIF
jgi:hypothetical protein